MLSFILHPIACDSACIGLVGSITQLSNIAGGLVIGRIADHFFRYNLKRLLWIVLLCCSLCYGTLTVVLPCAIWGSTSAMFPVATVVPVLTGLIAFFVGGAAPLIYEIAVECAFPSSETAAVGLITVFDDVGGLVLMSIPVAEFSGYMTFCSTVFAVNALILVSYLKVEYNRESSA